MAINEDIRDLLPSDSVIFENVAYDNSIIGTTLDGRVIYDYDLMVKEFADDEECTIDEAIDWVEYNTLRSLPYGGPKAPLVVSNVWL